MQPQPLIVVKNIALSRDWYTVTLGLRSGHGGDEYEQLMFDGRMVLQLHLENAHEHELLGVQQRQGRHGVALWFLTDDFDHRLTQIVESGAIIADGPLYNSNANHREVWLIDPDGYLVVVAGAPQAQ